MCQPENHLGLNRSSYPETWFSRRSSRFFCIARIRWSVQMDAPKAAVSAGDFKPTNDLWFFDCLGEQDGNAEHVCLEPASRLELLTCWLRISYSTTWVTPAFPNNAPYNRALGYFQAKYISLHFPVKTISLDAKCEQNAATFSDAISAVRYVWIR